MGIDFPNGSDNEVNVGNGESLRITGAITVMCWVILDVGSQDITFVSKYAAADRGWALQTDDDGVGGMFVTFWIAKTSSTGIGSGWADYPTGLPVGTLHHVAGVFVPSTSVQIYQDGSLGAENTTDVPATQYDAGNNVIIGGKADPSQNPDGKLFDVRVYNRALGANEIATIYASRGRDGIVDGLVGRWLLNEKHHDQPVSGANSVKDRGPHANHGSPVGSTTYVESRL